MLPRATNLLYRSLNPRNASLQDLTSFSMLLGINKYCHEGKPIYYTGLSVHGTHPYKIWQGSVWREVSTSTQNLYSFKCFLLEWIIVSHVSGYILSWNLHGFYSLRCPTKSPILTSGYACKVWFKSSPMIKFWLSEKYLVLEEYLSVFRFPFPSNRSQSLESFWPH